MDRKKLIDLLKKGMQYPHGKHRFWVSRCFEIKVRPDSVVELDEYEDYLTEKGPLDSKRPKAPKPKSKISRMFHVGRSVVNLSDGKVIETQGSGWEKN